MGRAPQACLIDADVQLRLETQLANAYCPYSKFQVACVVEDDQGDLHAGCNVENAAYPIGNCAEASALAIMIAAGGARRARTVYVTAETAGRRIAVQPCGACRQRITERASPAGCEIVMVGPGGSQERVTLADLLPNAFSLPVK
jgi:cytidine deaminase